VHDPNAGAYSTRRAVREWPPELVEAVAWCVAVVQEQVGAGMLLLPDEWGDEHEEAFARAGRTLNPRRGFTTATVERVVRRGVPTRHEGGR